MAGNTGLPLELAKPVMADTVGDTIPALAANMQIINDAVETHLSDYANPHGVTKTQVGLSNVTNDAQLPLSGGTMTGILYPQNNTDYTTGQARRIILSTSNPSGGGNGDIWIKYTV